MNAPLPPRQERPIEKPVPRPMPGVGTRLTANEAGFSYSAPVAGGQFAHPWKPSLGGFFLRFNRGIVQGEQVREPRIGGVPMSGGPGVPQPALKLEPGKANANGESYAVLEVEPNEKGVLDGKSRVEIVHSTLTNSHGPKIGRQPIALILWKNKRPYRVLPIVHFNLRYERYVPPPGGGDVRHFFL